MFERLGWTGSRTSGRQLARAGLLAGLALSAWAGTGELAFGQLRSGNVDRPLYQPSGSSIGSGAATVRSSSVTHGSRVVRARAQQSIVEDSAQQPAMPAAPSTRSQIQPSPDPLPNDDGMSTFDSGSGYDHANSAYEGQSFSGGNGGCSCGQCGGGGDYYSELAPGCSDGRCGIDPCGGPLSRLLGQLSIRSEAGLFYRRGMGLPPLVTTANAGTAANVAGQLGQNSTQILLGNNIVNQDMHAGYRINVATWLDPSQYRGVIVRYADAGDQTNDFRFSSATSPILARPFNNVTTGTSTPDTQLVSFPGSSVGDIRVRTVSEIDSIDVVIRRMAYHDRFTRVDWLVGYQHNHIAESLQISSNTSVTGNVPPLSGSGLSVSDLVRTSNNFNGGVLGLMSTRHFAYFKFEALGRLGLGSLERRVDLMGSTTSVASNGQTSTDSQGLLVRNTNNRPFQDNTFVTVPEFGLNAGYFLTRNIDFTVGYNYLLIPKVAQPGRQLDGAINLSDPLSGAMRPQLALSTQPYWLHSLNLGAQWRY